MLFFKFRCLVLSFKKIDHPAAGIEAAARLILRAVWQPEV